MLSMSIMIGFVYLVGGRIKTNIRLFDWAKEVEDRGAGEILFTSMDHDGTKNGFACQALEKLSQIVNIPIIASGGAGKIEHFNEVFKSGNIDAALAASVFHFNEIGLKGLKKELKNNKNTNTIMNLDFSKNKDGFSACNYSRQYNS